MSRGHRYFTNLAAQAGARLLFMLSTMLVFVLSARWLGVEAFGEFGYAMAYMAVIGGIAEAGTTAVLARELPGRKDDPSLARYFGNFILLRIACGVITAMIGAAVSLVLTGHDNNSLLLASIAAPLGTARFFDPVFQVFQRPWRGPPIALTCAVFYVVASVAVLLFAADPVPGLIIVYGVSGLAYALLALRASRDLLSPHLVWDTGLLRDMLRLALPLGVATICTTVNGRIGTLILAQLAPSAEVGQLTAAGKLVELGSVIVVTLGAPLLPILVSAAAKPDGLRQITQGLFEAIAVVTFPAAIVLWHMAPSLLSLIFGPDYAEAGVVLRILIWQLALVPISIIGSAVMLVAGSIRFSYWIGALAATINGAATLVLVPGMAASGAAIGALLAEFVMVGVMLHYLLRDVGQVFRLRVWLKILMLNGLLFAVMNTPLPGGPILGAMLGAFAYVALVLLGGIVPYRQLQGFFVHAQAERSRSGIAA